MRGKSDKKIILSIIVTAYNVGTYIEKCIESIINQKYENIQVIIIDDGSIDDTGTICNHYAKLDNRINVVHTTNNGVICARYEGIKRAKSQYVTFVDGDDFIDEYMYEKMMSLILKYKCRCVISGMVKYTSSSYMTNFYDDYNEGLYLREEIKEYILPTMIWNEKKHKFGLNPSLCNKIFLKEDIEDKLVLIKQYKFQYGEDMAVVYPLIKDMDSLYIINNAFYYHRQRQKNDVAPYTKDVDFFNKIELLRTILINNMQCGSKKENIINRQIDMFYFSALDEKRRTYYAYNISNDRWFFPFANVEKGCEIVIYGAGLMGQLFYSQIEKTKYCSIRVLVDKNYKRLKKLNLPVVGVDYLKKNDFDYVIVAIDNIELRRKISEEIIKKYDIEKTKVIYNF